MNGTEYDPETCSEWFNLQFGDESIIDVIGPSFGLSIFISTFIYAIWYFWHLLSLYLILVPLFESTGLFAGMLDNGRGFIMTVFYANFFNTPIQLYWNVFHGMVKWRLEGIPYVELVMLVLFFLKSVLFFLPFTQPIISFIEILIQIVLISSFNLYFDQMEACSYPKLFQFLGTIEQIILMGFNFLMITAELYVVVT